MVTCLKSLHSRALAYFFFMSKSDQKHSATCSSPLAAVIIVPASELTCEVMQLLLKVTKR